MTLSSDYSTFKETTLKDIDINLPNIQYLVFDNRFRINREKVNQMADILSRLSRLQTLKLKITSDLSDNEIDELFREKCKKLQFFEINS